MHAFTERVLQYGRLLGAFLALGLAPLSPAFGGKQAWTQAAVSPGLHSLGHPATAVYRPSSSLPANAVITQVVADRSYHGNADIETAVCWNGLQTCVTLTGRSVNTKAFAGLDANKPVYLVHRARAWRGTVPPVFVQGNVTVWYHTNP